MAPTASTLYKQQSRYNGKLTREYSASGTGTIYWSSAETLGITAGWFQIDAENTKGEELFITGITGTPAEYSGTVSIRGLQNYGANTNVPAKQFVHRATASIIVSDNHSWTDQIITAFLAHEQVQGAFHGFAGIGTTASRPAAAAGNNGMLYWSTDDLVLYYSNGTIWTAQAAGTQPDSTTSVKGVTKMSVAPASAASPIAVGDNDPRMMSTVNVTDLTDAGDTTLHFHANDRARENHTGTQSLSTILESGTSGETLTANDLVYFKSSDSKWYKGVDGADSWNVSHIVKTGGAINTTVTLIPLIGRIAPTTALTANTDYYRKADGTLDTSAGTMDSSTHIPMRIGRTDSTGNLVCNVQRIPRRKIVVQYQADVSSTTHTITVGFPISYVDCEIYMRNTVGAPFIYAAGTGYFNVLTSSQQCSLRAVLSDYICAVETSSSVYYKMFASISSNNLVLTLDSATLPGTGSSFIVHVFEAL